MKSTQVRLSKKAAKLVEKDAKKKDLSKSKVASDAVVGFYTNKAKQEEVL